MPQSRLTSGKFAGLRAVALGFALAWGSPEGGAQEVGAGVVAAEGINEVARLLAGMPEEGAVSTAELAAASVWKTHAEAMEQQWSRYERSTLMPMEEWSRAELAPRMGEGQVVRYMFSGPDILHAVRLFPQAGTFIMAGLEPVGDAPDPAILDTRTLARPLAEVRKALEEIIQFSFFKTIDMKVDLGQATFRGTLPIICLFLARSGIEIETVEFFRLAEDGSLTGLGGESEGADAVRLVTGMGEGMRRRTIYYFQTDISNGKVEGSGFLKFLESHPAGVAYAKAASYLMHNSYFSRIRDHLLGHSELLVEDDSGIPLRDFKPGEWEIALYGSYTAPIPLFQDHYQADLRKAYQGAGVKPLDFGTGYRWRKSDSNLLVAARLPEAPVARAVAIARAEPAAEGSEPAGESGPLVVAAPPVETVGDPGVAAPGSPAVDEARALAGTVPGASAPDALSAEPLVAATLPEAPAVAEAASETPPTPAAPVDPVVAKPVSEGPVEVTLKLVRKPDLSELGDLTSNALAVFEYEVVSVHRGHYPYPTMRLADGIVWGGSVVTPVLRREAGATISLAVVPLQIYPKLGKIRRIDSPGADEGLPIFVPRL